MDFTFTAEHEQVRETVRRFAEAEMAPLVREAATARARGRVFGFVYSGLDSGAAFGPIVAGLLLDLGAAPAVLWMVAGLFGLAIVAALAARRVS